ncbi:MAG: AAA family ATPase [Prosthecobacter sp.]|uniref:AAA family ATPase n=1 Tax=Prosthecobacter sp. TaxID=1965333 RepID=UPI0025F2712F|nr:ATP-binding protein [Prosthecobacter sp.]MCF7785222.1 AAA family ATPase [Prosthecobacter sp.]
MITRIKIQNYRSFVDAEVKLRPFSLVVGANGSGKSNVLSAIAGTSAKALARHQINGLYWIPLDVEWNQHVGNIGKPAYIKLEGDGMKPIACAAQSISGRTLFAHQDKAPWMVPFPVFNLDPKKISGVEDVIASSEVRADGSGTAQVLEMLKSGDREDLFDSIEEHFFRYVPEVEKLSLRTVQQGKKQIQVREKGLGNAILPATELSEGTRLVLAILTIIHQEKPPPVILLEDIDRGLHPRLFEFMAPLMKDIAERHQINILATTHNPYLVDCFQDDKEAVIIVEKKDGASTLSTLADRVKDLDYDKVDPDDMPLGNLWFSGLVGGVPRPINRRPQG